MGIVEVFFSFAFLLRALAENIKKKTFPTN
jgi:hypothetical protein